MPGLDLQSDNHFDFALAVYAIRSELGFEDIFDYECYLGTEWANIVQEDVEGVRSAGGTSDEERLQGWSECH